MRQIKDFPDYYVTDDGRVFSYKRGYKKELKLAKDNGYHRVCLSNNDIEKSICVHRLVAEAYIPNPNNLPVVCHRDDNGYNNHVSNLWWGTIADNNKDRHNKGRTTKGKDHPHYKGPVTTPLGTFITMKEAAAAHNITEFSIGRNIRLKKPGWSRP